jgi:hypothetical protein
MTWMLSTWHGRYSFKEDYSVSIVTVSRNHIALLGLLLESVLMEAQRLHVGFPSFIPSTFNGSDVSVLSSQPVHNFNTFSNDSSSSGDGYEQERELELQLEEEGEHVESPHQEEDYVDTPQHIFGQVQEEAGQHYNQLQRDSLVETEQDWQGFQDYDGHSIGYPEPGFDDDGYMDGSGCVDNDGDYEDDGCYEGDADDYYDF